MKLIGFTGKAGVGKSTMANRLINDPLFYHQLSLLSFASPLKRSLSELTGLRIEYFTDQLLKESKIEWLGMSPRELMQKFGTDFVRNTIHPEFWVMRMRERLKKCHHDVVIDDIRFDNEAALVRENCGCLIHIIRDVPSVSNHVSETPVRYRNGDYTTHCNNMDIDCTYTVIKHTIMGHFYEL
jgi:hypothetical protein